MLRRGQEDINPHFLGISKATAQPRYTRQQQRYNKRYNNSTSASTLAFVTVTVL